MCSANANQYVRSCLYLLSCESVLSVSDTNNQALSLVLLTTIPNNQTVRCNKQSEEFGTFECEFCYGPEASCQGLATCITVNSSAIYFPQSTDRSDLLLSCHSKGEWNTCGSDTRHI